MFVLTLLCVGDLLATVIGTEDGKARQRVIAGLHPEDGVARLALSPGRVEPTSTTAAAAAVPNPTPPTKTAAVPAAAAVANGTPSTTSPTPVSAAEPAPGPAATPTTNGVAMASDADLNIGRSPGSHVDGASRMGTYTVHANDESSTAADTRAGTSETRYIQQSGTHAEGTMADGTPDVKVDSQGEKQALMDPHTVGQAPKEHPLPIPEEPAPSIVDQAKEYAGQAVETAKTLPATVMSAVGMGGQKEEPVQEQAKKEDPAVDAMEGRNVEEFLRSQTMSKPESSGQT